MVTVCWWYRQLAVRGRVLFYFFLILFFISLFVSPSVCRTLPGASAVCSCKSRIFGRVSRTLHFGWQLAAGSMYWYRCFYSSKVLGKCASHVSTLTAEASPTKRYVAQGVLIREVGLGASLRTVIKLQSPGQLRRPYESCVIAGSIQ